MTAVGAAQALAPGEHKTVSFVPTDVIADVVFTSIVMAADEQDFTNNYLCKFSDDPRVFELLRTFVDQQVAFRLHVDDATIVRYAGYFAATCGLRTTLPAVATIESGC